MARFCRFCGNALPQDAAFCPQCGKAVALIINAPSGAEVVISDQPPVSALDIPAPEGAEVIISDTPPVPVLEIPAPPGAEVIISDSPEYPKQTSCRSAASTGKYPGWKAEIEAGRIVGFKIDVLIHLLKAVQRGEEPFFILTPPQLIANSRYLQVSSDDAGLLHLELCMARGSVGFEMYGMNGLSPAEAEEMFRQYLQIQAIPVPPAGFKWELL